MARCWGGNYVQYIIQTQHHLSFSFSPSLARFPHMDLRFNFVERCSDGARTCQDSDLVLQPKGQIQFTRQAKFKTRPKQTHWDHISKITARKAERVSYNRPLLQLRPWLMSKGTGTHASHLVPSRNVLKGLQRFYINVIFYATRQ